MKTFLLPLLFLATVVVNAQSGQEVFEKAHQDQQAGNYEEAVAGFEKCVELKFELYNSYVNIANIKMDKLNDAEGALLVVEKCVEAHPDSLNIHHGLAQFYSQLGKHDKSMIVLLHIAKYMASSESMFSSLDMYAVNSGDYMGVLKVLDEWINRSPESIDFHFIKAGYANKFMELRGEEFIEKGTQALLDEVSEFRNISKKHHVQAYRLNRENYVTAKALYDFYEKNKYKDDAERMKVVMMDFDEQGNYTPMSSRAPSEIFEAAQTMFAEQNFEASRDFYELCLKKNYKTDECRDELFGLYKWIFKDKGKVENILADKKDALPGEESIKYYSKQYGYGTFGVDLGIDANMGCIKRGVAKGRAYKQLHSIAIDQLKDEEKGNQYIKDCIYDMGEKCWLLYDYVELMINQSDFDEAYKWLDARVVASQGDLGDISQWGGMVGDYAKASLNYNKAKKLMDKQLSYRTGRQDYLDYALMAKGYGIAKMAADKEEGKSYEERIEAVRSAFEDALLYFEKAYEKAANTSYVKNLIDINDALGNDSAVKKWQAVLDDLNK